MMKDETVTAGNTSICISWADDDPENRIGLLRAGRYTSPNKVFAFVVAIPLTAAFFGLMFFVFSPIEQLRWLAAPFTRRSNLWTIIPTLFFFFWCFATLFIKSLKVRFQARALDLAAVPQQPDFVLTQATARAVLNRLYGIVDHPRHFILLNRIERALSNLQNIGGVSDVSTILTTQADNDRDQISSSYTLVSGLVWSIPVLGFIGTVLGLSQAIGTFGRTLQTAGNLADIKSNLQGVTGGLATAFETTLVALVCALIIQLYINYLQSKEDELMDECNDYCHAHVTSKLRLVEHLPEQPATVDKRLAVQAVEADRSIS